MKKITVIETAKELADATYQGARVFGDDSPYWHEPHFVVDADLSRMVTDGGDGSFELAGTVTPAALLVELAGRAGITIEIARPDTDSTED